MQIVLCYQAEERHIQQIAAVVPQADILAASQETIPEDILMADIFCGHFLFLNRTGVDLPPMLTYHYNGL